MEFVIMGLILAKFSLLWHWLKLLMIRKSNSFQICWNIRFFGFLKDCVCSLIIILIFYNIVFQSLHVNISSFQSKSSHGLKQTRIIWTKCLSFHTGLCREKLDHSWPHRWEENGNTHFLYRMKKQQSVSGSILQR